jgi:hypothetical protein
MSVVTGFNSRLPQLALERSRAGVHSAVAGWRPGIGRLDPG